MIYFSSLLILAFSLVLISVLINKKKKRIHDQKICLCLYKLERLKGLLIHIQRHRGLTCAFLQGDKHALINIQRLAVELDAKWRQLISNHPELVEDPLFEGIQNHWERLSVRWQSLQFQNNMEQHNRLINNLLFLIENHAVQHIELNKLARTTGLDVIWKELLEATEAIGQTRAIGVSLVAAKRSAPIERIKLKFLTDKVSRQLAELQTSLNSNRARAAQINGIDMRWANPIIQDAQDKAQALNVCINQHLMVDQEITLNTDSFFKLATDAIEPLETIFNHTTAGLIEKFQRA